MRHFLKIAEGVQIMALAHAVQTSDGLWEEDGSGAIIKLWEDGLPQAAWRALPQVRPILFDLMRIVEATAVRRVTIERLKPGAQVRIPVEEPTTVYEVWLHNLHGSGLSIGEETIQPEAGQGWVWRVAPDRPAEKVNGSADDSVSLQIELQIA